MIPFNACQIRYRLIPPRPHEQARPPALPRLDPHPISTGRALRTPEVASRRRLGGRLGVPDEKPSRSLIKFSDLITIIRVYFYQVQLNQSWDPVSLVGSTTTAP